jgi:SAM-dependent methyltransferase
MGELVSIVTPLHQQTARDYIGRMFDDKVHCMGIASRYGSDYWDGGRRYGYGGYKYIPGRWKPVAESLIERYELTNQSKILDVGCGKAFLLHELKLLLPGLQITGIDISEHGISGSTDNIRPHLLIHDARKRLPFSDDEFDLVLSLGMLHNFTLVELETGITEIARVGRHGYVMVESYRSLEELFNLQCWALTAKSFLDPEEWKWLYRKFGFLGDYEFIYFE